MYKIPVAQEHDKKGKRKIVGMGVLETSYNGLHRQRTNVTVIEESTKRGVGSPRAQVGAARNEGANLRGAWCVVRCVTCLETQDETIDH